MISAIGGAANRSPVAEIYNRAVRRDCAILDPDFNENAEQFLADPTYYELQFLTFRLMFKLSACFLKRFFTCSKLLPKNISELSRFHNDAREFVTVLPKNGDSLKFTSAPLIKALH